MKVWRIILITALLIIFRMVWQVKSDLESQLEFSSNRIKITALLYSKLDDVSLSKEINKINCIKPHCISEAIPNILKSEFLRHTESSTEFDFITIKPKKKSLFEIEKPSSIWTTLVLINKLKGEFSSRGRRFFNSQVRLFINIIPLVKGRKVERSIGTSQGRIGFIEWEASDNMSHYLWNLTKVAHELGHVFGASDKYSKPGESIFPQGYVVPRHERNQKYLEIMSGTRPTPQGEVQAKSWEELRFGTESAKEMNWIAK